MQTEIMDISPAQAADFLRTNRINRSIRMSWVKKLAGMIERGEWQLTHQGIALNSDNELLDGQHRLHAIVLANRTVPMQVTFDCERSAFLAVDNGIKRTLSDHLKVSNTEAAVCSMIWSFYTSNFTSLTPSVQQAKNLLEWASEPIEHIVRNSRGRYKFASAPIWPRPSSTT
jgi:hydrogenase maturation factor